MSVQGVTIGLAEILIVIGIGVLIGGLAKKISPGVAIVIMILCLGSGAYMKGWIDIADDDTDADTGDTGVDQYTTGLNVYHYLRDAETHAAISGKLLKLYAEGTTLQDIQGAKVSPLRTAAANTDSDGKTKFTGMTPGTYIVAFTGDEAAFDGSDYMAAAMTVTLLPVDKDLKTKDTYFENADTLYVKKIGDAFYTITATSGSNSSSGGVDADATITEDGTAGTTVHMEVSCATDKAWLTDSVYYCRFYLSKGGDSTKTLADCKLNSSQGQNIGKDSSGSYFVEVTASIMQNTDKNLNQVFKVTLWVPDLTATKTFEVIGKYTLVRRDSSNVTILQDAGHKITVTGA